MAPIVVAGHLSWFCVLERIGWGGEHGKREGGGDCRGKLNTFETQTRMVA